MEISEERYNELLVKEKELDNKKDFDYCNELGCRYQDVLTDELYKYGICLNNYCSAFYQMRYGENKTRIEIKHDSKITKTGNLYIEFEAISKDQTKMVDGGIKKVDKSWLYIIGNINVAFVFAKKQLNRLCEKVQKNPKTWKERYGIEIKQHTDTNGTITSSGMVLPIKCLDEIGICLLKLEMGKIV